MKLQSISEKSLNGRTSNPVGGDKKAENKTLLLAGILSCTPRVVSQKEVRLKCHVSYGPCFQYFGRYNWYIHLKLKRSPDVNCKPHGRKAPKKKATENKRHTSFRLTVSGVVGCFLVPMCHVRFGVHGNDLGARHCLRRGNGQKKDNPPNPPTTVETRQSAMQTFKSIQTRRFVRKKVCPESGIELKPNGC